MDINEIRIARIALERVIAKAIEEQLRAFHEMTGLSPESIEIRMSEVTRLESAERRFIITEVRANVRV